MKRVFLLAGILAVLLAPQLSAQNAVCNPQFSTFDIQHWVGTDPTYEVAIGPQYLGMDYMALKKRPGASANNGSITQEVHLIAGHTYDFSANIAAQYCSS